MIITKLLITPLIHVVRRIPLYLFMPKNRLRYKFMDKYLTHNGKYDKLLSQYRQKGYQNLTNDNLKVIVPYLMKIGQDVDLKQCLDIALENYPKDSYFYVLYAKYLMFLDDDSTAIELIKKAIFLDPKNAKYAALSVIITYQITSDIDEANKYALEILKKFPLNITVLWSVCKDCTTELQFNTILNIWSNALERKNNKFKLYVKTVAPLVNAASRVCLFKKGIELSLKASLYILQHRLSILKIPKNLSGKCTFSALEDIFQVFENCGIPFFFAAGTALGLIREGKVLDHDGDIDVGVFENNWSYDTLINAFKKHPRFIIAKPHPKTPKIGLVHRGGADIDVFKFYREKDHVYHDGVFVRWRNSPFTLKKHTVNGFNFNIPEPVDKYLTENYGDWRKPDPTFDAFLYAPNTEVTWQEYKDLQVIRTIYNSLCFKNRSRAKKVAMDNTSLLAMTPEGIRLAEILIKKN